MPKRKKAFSSDLDDDEAFEPFVDVMDNTLNWSIPSPKSPLTGVLPPALPLPFVASANTSQQGISAVSLRHLHKKIHIAVVFLQNTLFVTKL